MRVNGLTGYTIWPLAPALLELVELFQSYYKVPDPGALLVALATYAAFRLPGGNPLWMMIVGGPATGKTEMLNMISSMPKVYPISTMTRAALLSGTKRKDWEKGASGGLLNEIGDNGFLLFKDFTSVLGETHENKTSENSVLSMLRELQDGSYVRRVGTDGSRVISWAGKLGVLAACTTAIDEYRSIMSTLGDRFLFHQMSEIHDDQLEEVAGRADSNADKDLEQRAILTQAAIDFISRVPAEWPDRSDEEYKQCLNGLSVIVSRCRSQVGRNRHSREVEYKHAPEGPARVAGQFAKLDAGLELIGVPMVRRYQLIRRTAFFCIPPVRLTVLIELSRSHSSGVSMTALVEKSKFGDSTVRRAVEDLIIHGVVRRSGTMPTYRYHMADDWLERWHRHPTGSKISLETGQVIEFARNQSAENCKVH